MKNNKLTNAAKAAFPYTVPILTGYLFLGAAYGIYMHSLGFPAILAILTSIVIYAGAMEFVTANLLTMPFSPLNALIMTLMVNARHIFYGLSMLDKYKNTGKKKWYLIFAMCDETFSINCSTEPPKGIDDGWFKFFVSLFNQLYWILGVTLGALFGSLVPFDTTGIDFVMTALIIVLFINRLQQEKDYFSAFCGIAISLAALLLFGADSFIIPSMLGILAMLTFSRKTLERKSGDNG